MLTELPSIKSWKEWVPLTVTLLALIAFAFFTYYKAYPYGSSYAFDNTIYAAGGVPNGIAYWTLICGVFAVVMICINYGLRKLLHIKDPRAAGQSFRICNAKQRISLLQDSVICVHHCCDYVYSRLYCVLCIQSGISVSARL